MFATLSSPHASIVATRLLGRRLRVSQCAKVPADPKLVRPGYHVGPELWSLIRVTWPSGHTTDLHVRLMTSRQHLGGERRWFACPNCGHRVGCLYSPWPTEPFWCRRCHGLLYDSQYGRRTATFAAAKAYLKFEKAMQRYAQLRARRNGDTGGELKTVLNEATAMSVAQTRKMARRKTHCPATAVHAPAQGGRCEIARWR